MTDLTKITTPFGLLDTATQEALRAHGGQYEVWSASGWLLCEPQWLISQTYRVKPQPPKPREWWVNVYEGVQAVHLSRESADRSANHDRLECVHVREVLE